MFFFIIGQVNDSVMLTLLYTKYISIVDVYLAILPSGYILSFRYLVSSVEMGFKSKIASNRKGTKEYAHQNA